MQLNEPQINDSLDSKNFSMMVICRSIMYGISIIMLIWCCISLCYCCYNKESQLYKYFFYVIVVITKNLNYINIFLKIIYF